jgi:hypothetical protein
MAWLWISNRVNRRSNWSTTSRIAGPEQNAEARNCGARIERDHEALLVGLALECAIDNVRHDDEVHQEIEIEHNGIPAQDRAGKVDVAPRWNHVPETIGPTHVDQHEQQAHDDRAQRQQFAEDDNLANRLPVVDVGGDDKHHRRGGDANQEREVADVEPPAHLVPHRRQHEPGRGLAGVRQRARDDQHTEERQPRPVGLVAPQDNPDRGGHEMREAPDGLHGYVP